VVSRETDPPAAGEFSASRPTVVGAARYIDAKSRSVIELIDLGFLDARFGR